MLRICFLVVCTNRMATKFYPVFFSGQKVSLNNHTLNYILSIIQALMHYIHITCPVTLLGVAKFKVPILAHDIAMYRNNHNCSLNFENYMYLKIEETLI